MSHFLLIIRDAQERESLFWMLRHLEKEVDPAPTASEALTLLEKSRSKPYDAIFIDNALAFGLRSDMHLGFIREMPEYANTPIIAMSLDRTFGAELGPHFYTQEDVTKPADAALNFIKGWRYDKLHRLLTQLNLI